MPAPHSFMQSIADIVDAIDTQIGAYTDEKTYEARQRVIDTETGKTGIIISRNVENPEGGKGKGFIVQWMGTGGQSYYPMSELDKVNSKLKLEDPQLEDYLRTLWDTPEGPIPYAKDQSK